MTFFYLIIEFFKIGVFSVGGGYATIPFLYRLIQDYGWYNEKQLTDMIAVSMVTPGPVGANMATFAGVQTLGIFGGIIATIALVTPSLFFIILVSKTIKNFKNSFWTKAILYSLKPAGCGLLAAVGINLFKNNVCDIPSICLFLFLFTISFKFSKNAILYMTIASLIGIILFFCNIKIF